MSVAFDPSTPGWPFNETEAERLEREWARDTWAEDEAKERELGLAGS